MESVTAEAPLPPPNVLAEDDASYVAAVAEMRRMPPIAPPRSVPLPPLRPAPPVGRFPAKPRPLPLETQLTLFNFEEVAARQHLQLIEQRDRTTLIVDMLQRRVLVGHDYEGNEGNDREAILRAEERVRMCLVEDHIAARHIACVKTLDRLQTAGEVLFKEAIKGYPGLWADEERAWADIIHLERVYRPAGAWTLPSANSPSRHRMALVPAPPEDDPDVFRTIGRARWHQQKLAQAERHQWDTLLADIVRAETLDRLDVLGDESRAYLHLEGDLADGLYAAQNGCPAAPHAGALPSNVNFVPVFDTEARFIAATKIQCQARQYIARQEVQRRQKLVGGAVELYIQQEEARRLIAGDRYLEIAVGHGSSDSPSRKVDGANTTIGDRGRGAAAPLLAAEEEPPQQVALLTDEGAPAGDLPPRPASASLRAANASASSESRVGGGLALSSSHGTPAALEVIAACARVLHGASEGLTALEMLLCVGATDEGRPRSGLDVLKVAVVSNDEAAELAPHIAASVRAAEAAVTPTLIPTRDPDLVAFATLEELDEQQHPIIRQAFVEHPYPLEFLMRAAAAAGSVAPEDEAHGPPRAPTALAAFPLRGPWKTILQLAVLGTANAAVLQTCTSLLTATDAMPSADEVAAYRGRCAQADDQILRRRSERRQVLLLDSSKPFTRDFVSTVVWETFLHRHRGGTFVSPTRWSEYVAGRGEFEGEEDFELFAHEEENREGLILAQIERVVRLHELFIASKPTIA